MPANSVTLISESKLADQASLVELCRCLQEMLQAKDQALALMEDQIKQLKQQIEWLQRQLFWRKSEKIDPNQMWFDELTIQAIEQNMLVGEVPETIQTQVESHTRERRSGGRGALPPIY